MQKNRVLKCLKIAIDNSDILLNLESLIAFTYLRTLIFELNALWKNGRSTHMNGRFKMNRPLQRPRSRTRPGMLMLLLLLLCWNERWRCWRRRTLLPVIKTRSGRGWRRQGWAGAATCHLVSSCQRCWPVNKLDESSKKLDRFINTKNKLISAVKWSDF